MRHPKAGLTGGVVLSSIKVKLQRATAEERWGLTISEDAGVITHPIDLSLIHI